MNLYSDVRESEDLKLPPSSYVTRVFLGGWAQDTDLQLWGRAKLDPPRLF